MVRILRDFTQGDCEQYINRMDKLNSDLDKLLNGAPQTAVVEVNNLRRVDVAKHYQRVREHAITLHGALEEKLQIPSCPCEVCPPLFPVLT